MIKFGAEYAFLRTCRLIHETGEQEYVLDAIGLSSPYPLGLLCAVTGECENYKVARTTAFKKPID